ncbi:MAG TPA: hypothetical protein VJ418_37185 [Streptosporangiaceae bacterium]|nr:hypothetical protein [Streptosporangiaceae bacterium]
MSEATLAARDLLRRFPLIDGHNDLPWALRERAAPVDLAEPVAGTHTDLPRLAAGGVGASLSGGPRGVVPPWPALRGTSGAGRGYHAPFGRNL